MAIWKCRAVVGENADGTKQVCGYENTRDHPGVTNGATRQVMPGRIAEIMPTCAKCGAPWITDDELIQHRGWA